jgi:2-polyprenyl-3-methyl-5-hydroxy-6-metoxy-1,4-benzoquinol methylase
MKKNTADISIQEPLVTSEILTAKSEPKKEKTVESDIEKNYNRYYSTGIYKSRYPSINQQTLSVIHQTFEHFCIEKPAPKKPLQVLDYGCGEGRYLCHLLPSYPQAHFTAYDISSEPLQALSKSLDDYGERSRVDILYGEKALAKYSEDQDKQKFSIALLLFGVLSHIPSASQRLQILSYLRDSIDPTNGRLIISVPNKARRFKKIQRALNSHEITYSRTIEQQTIGFYYYLYDAESIQKEIQAAGLDIINVKAESVLPESWVTNYRLLGWIDRQVCRWIPAKWGYGILVSCKVAIL